MRRVFRVAGDNYAGMINWLVPDEEAAWERAGWWSKRNWIFTTVADASLSRQRLAKVLWMGKHRAYSSAMIEGYSVKVGNMVFCPLLVTSPGVETPEFRADTPKS